MPETIWPALALGYLIPLGFFLIGWGGTEPARAPRVAARGLLALALATVGYFATGFAFHLGGAAVFADTPGLEALGRIWSPLDRVRGLGWGAIGLSGFFLTEGTDTPQALALFLTYLPTAATAAVLSVLALPEEARGWRMALVGLLTGALLFPLAACWVWGGGWLASLGQTLARGHGTVDFAGSGVVFLLSGMVALGSLVALGRRLPPERPREMPPAHFPLLAALGLLLATVGWLGWALGSPWHVLDARLNPGLVATNGLLALAGAALTAFFYGWLVLGESDPLMAIRGAAGGWVAISAGAPFLPPWAALTVGMAAGLLVPMGIYLMDYILRLPDAAASVGITVLPGLWGLLAVALFADGRWGQGWNNVGLQEYRTVVGQGVSGFAVAPGFLGDGPGQLIAQATGIFAIALWGFLGGWAPLALARGLAALAKKGEREGLQESQ